MPGTPTLDLILVLVVLAAAAGFLVWSFTAREAKPACHLTGGPRAARADGSGAGPSSGGDVVVGASLARGLERARARANPPRAARV